MGAAFHGVAAWNHGRRLWLAAVVCACAGCAANYQDVMRQVGQDLAAQQPQAALKSLDKLQGGGDQLLYLLNKAMVLRMQGDYAGSVQAFEQAKPLMLYLEATSVTETAAALTLSEGTRTYQAPLYERLLVHVYQALNFLQMGEPDQARVEAAQIDDLLKRLYPNTDASPTGGDAFPRYFSGLVYEDLGEYSDAMIAYRQAYQGYKAQGDSDAAIPQDLKLSLCRLADFLGLNDELDGYKQRFGIDNWPPVDKQDAQGQVIFVFGDGLGPLKFAQTAMLPNPANGHYYSVTLPVLRRRPPMIQAAEVTVADDTVRTERVASIAADASQQMAADRPKLLAAEFSRNVVRNVAANEADKKAQGLGMVVSLIASAADQADIRIWGTLPDNIQVARLRLPPGIYDLTVRFVGGGGAPRVLKNVQVQAGQMTFASLQWAYLN
ncbi:MAG: COG3014 family protein [Bacillota bacterium]